MRPFDPFINDFNASFTAIKTIEDERSVKQSKKDEVDSLGCIVRIKELEARLFQSRAADARGEAVSLRRLARLESKKLNETYYEKLSKLCSQETEVACLLTKMEAAKQLLV
ncbi:hypothetical protein R3W88_000021 [Solanum pinnatisectum]|uniref:Oberon coiled-coil region domain-containing protein n=1 Tax=Solanum pinnatisectum TaxID=50273 RepID=A0AAV9MGZ3_9SOLN|nr:hypothetical protein R3W88_000021 [Solanum pinnatisectum]